jgi:SAM-dependent methyltransferase
VPQSEEQLLDPRARAFLKARAAYKMFTSTGSSSTERERLRLLATCFDPKTIALFEMQPIQAGWDVLEVGAGDGSIARWLAKAVGVDGRVVATDTDRRLGLAEFPPLPSEDKVQLIYHDVGNDPLPPQTFDCVHTRSLLHLLPNRQDVLSSFARCLKPGGRVVIEEIDASPALQSPLEPYGSVWRVLAEKASSLGIDLVFGASALSSLHRAGFEHTQSVSYSLELRGASSLARLWALTWGMAAEFIVGQGMLSETVFAQALNQLADRDFRAPSPVFAGAVGQIG